jgi:hypothetical protein
MKKFQPPPRTKKILAAAAESQKKNGNFWAAAADHLRVFKSRRRRAKKIENSQPPPLMKASAYTSTCNIVMERLLPQLTTVVGKQKMYLLAKKLFFLRFYFPLKLCRKIFQCLPFLNCLLKEKYKNLFIVSKI